MEKKSSVDVIRRSIRAGRYYLFKKQEAILKIYKFCVAAKMIEIVPNSNVKEKNK